MHKIELFNKDNKILRDFLKNKVIVKIEYLENIPLEDNCIKISFSDNSYFLIYSTMRMLYQDKLELCSADYYFDKRFIEDVSNQKSLKNTLIYEALIKANEILKNKVISSVEVNCYGDLTLGIGADVSIEVFIDVTENDKDYYIFYGVDDTYFHLYKSETGLTIIEDV